MTLTGICYICSKPAMYTCSFCGRLVCTDCYSKDKRLCKNCEGKYGDKYVNDDSSDQREILF